MINAMVEADEAYKSSVKISAALCALVALQSAPLGDVDRQQCWLKAEVKSSKRTSQTQLQRTIIERATTSQRHVIQLASEKGGSSWLTTLPLEDLGFHLHKAAFRDGLALRYNWPLSHLPLQCVCVVTPSTWITRCPVHGAGCLLNATIMSGT